MSKHTPVAWRWMPAPYWKQWVYSDDGERVAEAKRFMGDGGVQPLYTNPPAAQPAVPLTDEQIYKAAMKLAECMDYPWAQMPEQGKQSMRNHAKAVIEAAAPEKVGAA